MAHALRPGTAWDRREEDYAYTRELDSTGWAWEFLRRNNGYRRAFRMNRAGHPVAIQHASGATLYRPRRRFLAAEEWGLELFANPDKTALEADIFWLPELTWHAVQCDCEPTNDNASDAISLCGFRVRRAVLAGIAHEQVSLAATQLSATMVVGKGTLLFGACAVTFLHKGLGDATRHFETLQVLKKLVAKTGRSDPKIQPTDSKLLSYLIALDGHLAGRSAREIAAVLFGFTYVKENWEIPTGWLKSRVRRAITCGEALMNGGYRKLL